MSPRATHVFEFGPFSLDPEERVLRRGGEPVRLQEKVLETLLVLVRRHGHIVDKEELMGRVWPDVAVEENNLNKAVSAARKALGEGRGRTRYIETVPKRGYRFVAPVQEREGNEDGTANRAAGDLRSLAVLPFRLMSPSRSDQYLGVGMADALITRLSNVREVVVRPTSAVLRYQAEPADAVAAGRELRVDSVLEGSIRRVAERIRVTVQLVNSHDGVPLWAEKFDEKLTDIFAVEDSISERAARALTHRLSHEVQEAIGRHATSSAEAHQLYLKGRYHAAKFTPAGLRKALECLEGAAALDPTYALAHLGLAYCYFAACNEFSLPPLVAMPKAREAAQTALRYDDRLGEAHLYLGGVRCFFEWDFRRAEPEFERAVELSPTSAVAHSYRGHALAWMERFEAGIAACRRAKEIDPVSPETITNLGIAYLFARRGRRRSPSCSRRSSSIPAIGSPGCSSGGSTSSPAVTPRRSRPCARPGASRTPIPRCSRTSPASRPSPGRRPVPARCSRRCTGARDGSTCPHTTWPPRSPRSARGTGRSSSWERRSSNGRASCAGSGPTLPWTPCGRTVASRTSYGGWGSGS